MIQRQILSALVLAVIIMACPGFAQADCTGPSGIGGQIIWNTTYSVMQYCNGTNWINMGGVSSSVTAAGSTGYVQFNTGNVLDAESALVWDKTNNRLGIGSATPATALDVSGTATATLFSGSGASLTALNASSLSSGTVGTARLGSGTADNTVFLRGDSTWAAVSGVAPGGAAGGDLSGSYPSPTVAKINGAAVGTATATAGNLLIGSGTQWVTNAVTGDVTITSGGVTAIGSSKVTNAMLAGSVALSKLSTTGTADGSTYLRGDGAWSTISALSGGSAGYGAVWSSATALTYDSALYVDATNHRIGVGTASPSYPLHVNVAAAANNTNLLVDNSGVSGGYNAIVRLKNSAREWLLSGSGAASGLDSSGAFGIYDQTSPAWRFVIDHSGNVGIGTITPSVKLDVAGTIISRIYNAGSSTSIDWSQSNVAYTSANCGAMTFTNMQDGGTYALAVKGTTSGTCSFSQSGLTFKLPAGHGATTAAKMTFYSFTRMGSDVFVTWIPGY